MTTEKQTLSGPTPSDGTRERLLEAALDVFGELGFKRASTRVLADAADVNLSAIAYYFGGKKGLYLAVAEHIGERVGAQVKGPLGAVVARLESAPAPDETQLRGLLKSLVVPMVGMIVGAPETARWAGYIMREQAQPTEALAVLQKAWMTDMTATMHTILGRLLQRDAHDESVALLSLALFGQFMVFRTSRAVALQALNSDDFTPRHIRLIEAMVSRNIDAMVDAAQAEQPETGRA